MITGVTRKALIELFAHYDPDPLGIGAFVGMTGKQGTGITWWGDLDELTFLKRLYNLEELPTTDERYENAYWDIVQHRENNYDWEDDWIFYDDRPKLNSSDAALLKFLCETLHPEVRADSTLAKQIKNEINLLLAQDNYALKQELLISGRPVYKAVAIEAKKITALEIRDEIAYAIRDCLKAYDVEGFCDALDLPPISSPDVKAFASKATYAKDRLKIFDKNALVKLARQVYDSLEYEPLEELLNRIDAESNTPNGVAGNPKNLIFAAKGLKPEIFMSDSIDNDIGFSKYAENVLVYEENINPNTGLSWQELLVWWMKKERITDQTDANHTLYARLRETCSPVEAIMFDVYGHMLKEYGFDIPAIIPQIYLHFDPMTEKQRGGSKVLFRQRMDFLMLLPNRIRVVLELDGVQHYSLDNGRANPVLYAKTMEEDRKLHLRGYQVFRFGGADFVDAEKAKVMMREFFEELLMQSGVLK